MRKLDYNYLQYEHQQRLINVISFRGYKMSLVFVAIKTNYKVLTFFAFLIRNFSGPIGKNGGVLPLGMGPNFVPKIA